MHLKYSTPHLIRSVLLVIAAIIGNIALGHLAQFVLQWPLYLDSISTILVGALLGPLAGAATGALSNIIWYVWLGDQSILHYTITAAFIGWAAGFAVSRGGFDRFGRVALSGLLVGIGAALISAPITAYVFGNITGSGTDYLTRYLSTTGANLLQAATIQEFISDPVDKIISFVLAWLLWMPLRRFFLPPSERGTRLFESLQGYSLAVAISLLSLLISFIFLPAFERGTFAIFYVAVLISAWRGGFGPALVTTAVGAFANILFLVSPYYNVSITAQYWLRVAVFVFVSVLIALIAYQLEMSKRDLERSLKMERESRARIRAITDGVNEALVLVSPSGYVMDANQHFVDMFGVPLERFIGQNLQDTRTLFDQIFQDAGELYEMTLTSITDTSQKHSRLVTQNWPQKRELQLYSTPVDDDGGFLGRLFVFRDVTHEREVDRMKTEFVSLVSHELLHNYFPFYMGIDERRYPFMDEGWTTAFEYLFNLEDMGKENADKLFIKMRSGNLVGAYPGADIPIIMPADTLRGQPVGRDGYDKAAVAYLALKELMGDEAFGEALHEFITRWNGKRPLPWDMFATFNDVSDEDLNWFFKNWFFSQNYIDLAVGEVEQVDGGYTVQVINTGGFAMPFDVKVEFADGTQQILHQNPGIWKDSAESITLKIESDKELRSVTLDGGIFVDNTPGDNTWSATPAS